MSQCSNDRAVSRNANVLDAERIFELINYYAAKGLVLSKTLYRIYSTIESFVVVEIDNKIVGCSAVVVLWNDMAEIRSLVVDDRFLHQRIGRALIDKCISKARQLKVPKIIALTYQTDFFEKLGFQNVDKNKYLRKLLVDCLDCPKLECCDESAYEYEL
jgi:amino-acid N-acetyltransferase